MAEKIQTYVDLGATGFFPWTSDYPSTESIETVRRSGQAVPLAEDFFRYSNARSSGVVGFRRWSSQLGSTSWRDGRAVGSRRVRPSGVPQRPLHGQAGVAVAEMDASEGGRSRAIVGGGVAGRSWDDAGRRASSGVMGRKLKRLAGAGRGVVAGDLNGGQVQAVHVQCGRASCRVCSRRMRPNWCPTLVGLSDR